MERLLLAPGLPQQGAANHAGRALEAGAEAEGDVGARLGAAAAGQVDLEPAEGRQGRGGEGGGGLGRVIATTSAMFCGFIFLSFNR